MKRIKTIALLYAGFVFSSTLQAQECAVSPQALKGTYTGACADKKANGYGKASGLDTYEGSFKNGYPDGSGKYTWKNQDYYTGKWKKGSRDGKGEMHYRTAAGGDSTVSGYWKKDKYAGEYEKSFEVISMSSRVNRVECRYAGKSGDDIVFTVAQLSSSSGGNAGSLAVLNNITLVKGNYFSMNTQVMTNSSVTRIRDVAFPFRARFNFSTGENTEIQFNEPGDYDVTVTLQ
jgi:hypothetical protein